MTARTALVPLRVDVSSHSNNASIRVVDTILLDPSCWPITPLSPSAVERNVEELAQSILSDAEVIGMGRTIRHFTGRVDLYSKILHDQLADQLRPQLYKVLDDMMTLGGTYRSSDTTKLGGMQRIHLCINTHGVLIQDSFDWDPSVDLSPITFAEQMVVDLNLPEEATVAIATAILEQLHGVQMAEESHTTQSVTTVVKEVDAKDQASNISHIVGFYR